jgi:hypothetical protein
MSNFCPDQGRTRVYGEAYVLYAVTENPRRTPNRAKRAIYGWTLYFTCDSSNRLLFSGLPVSTFTILFSMNTGYKSSALGAGGATTFPVISKVDA